MELPAVAFALLAAPWLLAAAAAARWLAAAPDVDGAGANPRRGLSCCQQASRPGCAQGL